MEKDFEKLRITIRDFANKYYDRLKHGYTMNSYGYIKSGQASIIANLEQEHGEEDAKYLWFANVIFKDYTLNEIKDLMK